ncbi:MBL fold metallo-hydrolase [Streptomyces sp. SID3343]|uniref:MBL fold metallo-hydrolase n=1 Tax=Streptomyces sp. SID3343 TaxID=2690260 RepID=UPI001368B1D3|nr:MBL fold metallo-hydrolase [Streptomyces sp. SID3343]MYV98300.1 MBL fold metallo-hydrolase [Streptomyces sp. SID3343]
MELVLLGTAGGPRPSVHRGAPAQAILHRGRIHVVDCGNGVAGRLVKAGLALRDLAGVYVTHHHADHMLDIGALPLTAWTDGLKTGVDVYGPPTTAEVFRHFLAMVDIDLRARTATTGRVPFPELITCHDVPAGGVVYEADGLRVTAAVVDHPPMEVALAYRFDTEERSIVVSGDTRHCPAMVELARGADVLVHEALHVGALELQLQGSGADTLREHLTGCHTSAQDVGRIATAAGVGKLVLSHLVPYHAEVTDDMWREAAGETFDGEIVVGHDFLRV